jgi:hypothetical protein
MRISIFSISLFLIIFIPNIYFSMTYRAGTTSMATSLAFTVLFILFIFFLKSKKFFLDRSLIPICTFLVLTFLTSIYSVATFDNFSYNRFFLSYILFWFIVLGSFVFVKFSLNIDDKKLYNSVSIIFYLTLIDGISLLINNVFFIYKKSFLIFPEPSHFALIFLPILLFKVLTFKKNIYIDLIILISFIMGVFLPNLTLLVGLVLISLIYSIKKTFFYIILIISIYIFFNFEPGSNIRYFVDRLNFKEVQNVSTLAFFSGWERAYLSLSETNFFGVGFNQLGIVGPSGIYQKQLESYALEQVTLRDGGSVAPKIIAELGFLGIIMLLLYLFYFIKKIYIIKKKNLTFSYLNTFYYSIFIMSFINLFIRGSGYFSPIFFLFLSSIIYFCTDNGRSHNILKKK